MLLKYSPPSVPNGIITGYKVLVYLDDPKIGVQPWKWEEINEDAHEMYIGQLLRESDYILWFKIAAKTIAGLGPYSRPFTAKLLTFDCKLQHLIIVFKNTFCLHQNNVTNCIMVDSTCYSTCLPTRIHRILYK